MGSRTRILSSQTYCASGLQVMAASPQRRETVAYHKAAFTAGKSAYSTKKAMKRLIHFHHISSMFSSSRNKNQQTSATTKKHNKKNIVLFPRGKRSVSVFFSFFDAQLFDPRWKRCWWSRWSRWSCLGGLKPGDLRERSKDPRKLLFAKI